MEQIDLILGNIKAEEVKSPYIQRLCINIIDGVIEVVILVAFYLLSPGEPLTNLLAINPLMKYILALIVIFAYRWICILTLGRTIGMILCRSKYLNNDLLPLTQKEKLIAAFLIGISGIKNYKV